MVIEHNHSYICYMSIAFKPASAFASLSKERSPEPLEPAKDEEGVFEIRDFTTVTTFERLSQQISLATKHWAQALPDSSEVLQMRDSFELGGFRRKLRDNVTLQLDLYTLP